MSIVGAFLVPHPPLIVPEIGKGEERAIKKTIEAYQRVAQKVKELLPDVIVIASPHATMYADYFHVSPGAFAEGDFQQFSAGTLQIKASYDEEFVRALEKNAAQEGILAGTLGERQPKLDHGTMVPLYFLEEADLRCPIIRVGLSGYPLLEHYRLGRCIAKTAEALERKAIFIASGDLSHKLKNDEPYGYTPQGPQYDQQVTEWLEQSDFLSMLRINESFCEQAAECGHRSIVMMAGALDGKSIESKLLSYEGPYGVGYAVASFFIVGDDDERRFDRIFEEERRAALEELRHREDEYVKLARRALETFIKDGQKISETRHLPKEMTDERGGVFVSIKKDGQLRGCIGTISAVTESVACEIIENAISAGTRDPRFDPVQAEELATLVYDVDVLNPPEPISSPKELDVKRYGLIVTRGNRRGLLLPNLEGVTSVSEQIRIALSKAGISSDEPYFMERFEVVRHE